MCSFCFRHSKLVPLMILKSWHTSVLDSTNIGQTPLCTGSVRLTLKQLGAMALKLKPHSVQHTISRPDDPEMFRTYRHVLLA